MTEAWIMRAVSNTRLLCEAADHADANQHRDLSRGHRLASPSGTPRPVPIKNTVLIASICSKVGS